MSTSTIRLHRVLRATPERIYRAFLDPDAMGKWLPPNGFTGKVHHMDARVGGVYKMSFTNFYVTMKGLLPVKDVDTRIADGPGAPFLAIHPLRPNHDPTVLRQKLLKVAREASPYVLIAEDPAEYRPSDDAYGQLWLMAIGRPAIEELLADAQFVKVARFSVEGTPLVLLENRRLVTNPSASVDPPKRAATSSPN